MAITPELVKYVSDARAQGVSDALIRQALVNAGWQPADIDAVLVPLTPPQNASMPSATPLQSPFQNASKGVSVAQKPHKSHLAFFITVIILLAAGAAVYLFLPQILVWYSNVTGQPLSAPSDGTLTQDTTVASTTASVTWKLYHNDAYHFQVMYPENWSIAEYPVPSDTAPLVVKFTPPSDTSICTDQDVHSCTDISQMFVVRVKGALEQNADSDSLWQQGQGYASAVIERTLTYKDAGISTVMLSSDEGGSSTLEQMLSTFTLDVQTMSTSTNADSGMSADQTTAP